MEWYAIFVETGKEEIVQNGLSLTFLKRFSVHLYLKERKLGKVYPVLSGF